MREIKAYKTMFQFLEQRYRLLPSDALGSLLGDLHLLEDGEPADPAMAQEWDEAVEFIHRSQLSAVPAEPLRKAS
jgi:hypothetical protein